ncbi:hypothetical protein FHR84_000496 [Actinopolyspora biskrensis]|uniref:Uncharacterized protein n=1 Tax=Actinopolyspora biskrensis TaxID=1470178 RepID=A0A852YTX4_9ACTN|nr:hypothetical protein [Actinopolyspora biskrensis]
MTWPDRQTRQRQRREGCLATKTVKRQHVANPPWELTSLPRSSALGHVSATTQPCPVTGELLNFFYDPAELFASTAPYDARYRPG